MNCMVLISQVKSRLTGHTKYQLSLRLLFPQVILAAFAAVAAAADVPQDYACCSLHERNGERVGLTVRVGEVPMTS